ncbi:hypothetical protein HanIR_Chr12g0579001 [Helianthus annuus]|nr:hypothetical protein HanIR_Chr12g0579001 [Helianthus annuus]
MATNEIDVVVHEAINDWYINVFTLYIDLRKNILLVYSSKIITHFFFGICKM